ncbi:HAD family phosphatase [Candidatus Woesearchaeota archaeon]|nr:HAD family phosphatase [Candidatus Woesearchaeota archaeon]
MVKVIIFDVGGVLMFSDMVFYKKISKYLGIDSKKLIKLRDKLYYERHKGKLTSKQVAFLIKKEFGIEKDVMRAFRKYYLELKINKSLLKIINRLKKKYKVAIVSNMDDLSYKINKERGIFSGFDEVIISHKVRLVKPQTRIFKLALKKLDVKAHNCVFVDDSKDNINVARKLGFKVIHFKNNKQLIKELKNLSIQV